MNNNQNRNPQAAIHEMFPFAEDPNYLPFMIPLLLGGKVSMNIAPGRCKGAIGAPAPNLGVIASTFVEADNNLGAPIVVPAASDTIALVNVASTLGYILDITANTPDTLQKDYLTLMDGDPTLPASTRVCDWIFDNGSYKLLLLPITFAAQQSPAISAATVGAVTTITAADTAVQTSAFAWAGAGTTWLRTLPAAGFQVNVTVVSGRFRGIANAIYGLMTGAITSAEFAAAVRGYYNQREKLIAEQPVKSKGLAQDDNGFFDNALGLAEEYLGLGMKSVMSGFSAGWKD